MLLHLLVLAPFVAAILMVATSKEDPKSSSRLAFLFGVAFFAMSIALVAVWTPTVLPFRSARVLMPELLATRMPWVLLEYVMPQQ